MFKRIGARLISALDGSYKIKVDKEKSLVTFKLIMPFGIVNDSIDITHTELNQGNSSYLSDFRADSL